MTEQAEAWSEHDLDRRFGLGEPHDELTRLASTLDRLLDRIAASLRHERRFSAELSHELRTPLAKVTAEAELALRRPREPGGVPRGAERDPRQRASDRPHRRRAARGGAAGRRPARRLRRRRGRACRRRRVPAGRRRARHRADGRRGPAALPGRGRRRSRRAHPAPGARQRVPLRAARRLALARTRRRRRALHRRRRRPGRRAPKRPRRSSSPPCAASAGLAAGAVGGARPRTRAPARALGLGRHPGGLVGRRRPVRDPPARGLTVRTRSCRRGHHQGCSGRAVRCLRSPRRRSGPTGAVFPRRRHS